MPASEDTRKALDDARADLRAYRALTRPTNPAYAAEVQRLETIVAQRQAEVDAR